MSLPFLKISPEEAVSQIQDMILEGYELKDTVNAQHEQARITGGTALIDIAPTWGQSYEDWQNRCLKKLQSIYDSKVYAYNFRDAGGVSTVSIAGSPTRSRVVIGIQSRIEKLNEYEKFVRGHVPIEINAGRDIYLINGDGADVRTKNSK